MDRVVIRTLSILAVTAAAAVAMSRPAAAADATGTGAVVITDSPASIQVTQNLTFQNMVPTAPTANLMVSGGNSSAANVSGAVNSANAANAATPANVSLKGSPGDAISLSVPAALELSRAGEAASVKVMITSVQGKAVLITGLNPDGALSVDLGGRVALGGTVVEPGAYEGLLLVIAQYN